MGINDREKMVLGVIIDYYLTYGDTVGSRSLVKKYGLSLSSATIRNVMADLEDLGYIEKTHTSSGRVPTTMGYKYYLDSLIEIKKLSEDEIERINLAYNRKMNELEDVLERTSRLLSRMTKYAGVVLEPDIKHETVKKIELVHVSDYTVLAVIVMKNNNVKTKKLHFDEPITDKELKVINEEINKKLETEDVSELFCDLRKSISALRGRIVDDTQITDDDLESIRKIYLSGAPALAEKIGHANTEEALNIMKFFGGKKDAKTLFESIVKSKEWEEKKVHVMLGEDLGVPGLEEMSFVFSVYDLGGSKGVIGVVGPRRMEYSKTVGLVEYVTHEVDKAIKDITDE